MKRQNSDKKFTILDDYFRCNFFKSNKRVNNRCKSINIYKNNKLEILIRKTKNKAQNIFELIKFQNFLLNYYKPEEIKDKDGNAKYVKFCNKVLGKGGFGTCYLFRSINKDDMNYYAGKIIQKKNVNNQKKSLTDEINIQKLFKNNSKIVGVKDYFEDDDNVYIILEYCKNKSLQDYLIQREGRLKEIEVKCFIFQLLQGLKYLQQKKVIHRDLKPKNLLLDDKNELKIGDFGLVVQLTNEKERKFEICGTYNYMAPEIFENEGKGYSFEVDIWSVGIIMYQLLTGKLPFNGENNDEIQKNILSFQPENLDVSELTPTAADLIKQILVKDPKKRPGINQIVYHFFFHDTEFPEYIPPEDLNKIIEENNKEGKKEDEEKSKNLKLELYNLIIDDIPEIKHKNIKNYVIKETVEAYKYYITYYHESSRINCCYYEFNNEIVGMILKNNIDKKINMIYNTETKIFYHININEDNEDGDGDEIKKYTKEEIPENLKKYANLIIEYYNLRLEKRKSIKAKEENSIKEQYSTSHSSKKSEQNSLSNENSIISQNRVFDKNNLIYVRDILSHKESAMVTLLFLSDKTIEAIFADKYKILLCEAKDKIEIINKDNEINVVSSNYVFLNSNIEFKKRLKLIRSILYRNIRSKWLVNIKEKENIHQNKKNGES